MPATIVVTTTTTGIVLIERTLADGYRVYGVIGKHTCSYVGGLGLKTRRVWRVGVLTLLSRHEAVGDQDERYRRERKKKQTKQHCKDSTGDDGG